ncbi:hypothetical protein [Burkholderia sp. WSM2230]|uniref:hypothetical protein n=1 Tax=Burkholderia sp. WSM2230 TaxID=944435 RepID=UPI0004074019|nr:hypothetical protein [Burkholderia sp. WSM2230]
MIPYLSQRENEVEHINSICFRLFDIWCERRCVTPLGYLMHCWPLVDSGPKAIRRVGETLRELRKSHHTELDSDAEAMLRELADCVDDLLLRVVPEPAAVVGIRLSL